MEKEILSLINREWTCRSLDLFMAAMSSFDLWIVPLAIMAVCLLIFGGFNGRAFVVIAGLLVGISDGVVSQGLKKIVQRPRPHEVLADVRRVDLKPAHPRLLALFRAPRVTMSRPEPGKRGGNSFPSAHTTNNFCLAVTASAFFRRRGWLVFIVAACVGYSRIYTGSHWPSDVLASAFIGSGVALIGLPLCQTFWKKMAARFAPELFARHPVLFGEMAA